MEKTAETILTKKKIEDDENNEDTNQTHSNNINSKLIALETMIENESSIYLHEEVIKENILIHTFSQNYDKIIRLLQYTDIDIDRISRKIPYYVYWNDRSFIRDRKYYNEFEKHNIMFFLIKLNRDLQLKNSNLLDTMPYREYNELLINLFLTLTNTEYLKSILYNQYKG